MEDDDEFGDLYTDVLTTLTSAPAPIKSPPIDDEIIHKSPNPKQITLAFEDRDSNEVHKDECLPEVVNDLDVIKPSFQNLNSIDKDENLEKFDIEEANTEIPGVSDSGNKKVGGEFGGEGEDWDSDSEDDLQIVLNDNEHGPMGMGEGEDDDDDGLVIFAGNDQIGNHEQIEEQDWGEDLGQGEDGERKELGDGGKVSGAGGVAQVAKFGFGAHGYHPYHSQFKYVRPGAAPMPGVAPVAPGGAPGQFRPPVNMGPITGRGRGDWRPTGMQKSFVPGYGAPAWGNNTSGRGFGSGLDFTLPSHKTIFEVDIDSFEEKPWRLVGIDISDFFNFGLNEETWKDYCKQLEQLRLEATMQSKIRVYESGRTEQEYDPDMPPELAAAAFIHDVSSENANIEKADGGQSDIAKGSARVRPQLPTGRAIQVETGYGERLPSIDTRPPRMRDSDAIIEIVLQDSSEDDESIPGNDMAERPDNDPSREDLSGVHETQDAENFDRMPQAYNDTKREVVGRRAPLKNSVHDKITEGAPIPTSSFLAESPVQNRLDSRGQNSGHTGRNFSAPRDERRTKGRERDRSPSMTPGESTQDKRFLDNQKEESVESVDGNPSLPSSSPVTVKVQQDAMHDELVLADGSSEMGREEIAFDTTTPTDFLKDETLTHSVKKQKLNSQLERPSLQEIDDGEDLKAERSSENSKARSGSSREYHHYRDGVEVEVVQDGRSTHTGIINRHLGDDDHRNVRSKGYDDRKDMQRHRMTMKRSEDPYHRKNWDSNSAHHSHKKTESIDRRKESDNSDGAWQRKDEGPHGRRSRAEDMRKREFVDETGPKYRKVRENERSDSKDEYQSRKQMDNGSWRGGHQDKGMESRHGDRDESLKTRNENLDDLQSKRRKEEAQLRRDRAEKEEILLAHRESSSRRKRERDESLDHIPNKKDMLDQRKRDDPTRLRNDDQRSVRHKEEGWSTRERVERQRERDEWQGLKQSREDNLSKRESRSVKTAEDKAWVVHSKVKDEYKGSDRDYHFKDTGRHSEQPKRKDRVESDSLSLQKASEDVYARGTEPHKEERRSRQERGSARSDRAISASDNHRVHEKKHRENPRKSKEREGGHNPSESSRRNQEDHSGQISERVRLRGMIEQGNSEYEIHVNNRPSKKHKEDASSDDEQQDSRRGRSKLERWTSHKERDFSIIGTKLPSSSSLNVREIDGYKNISNSRHAEESPKAVEVIEDAHQLNDEKDFVGGEPEIKNVDAKPMEDRHLDTVEKLKKRSERFKLPMPSEKEAIAIKKMENEPLPSSQTEIRTDSEVKHERPPRKRRWISS